MKRFRAAAGLRAAVLWSIAVGVHAEEITLYAAGSLRAALAQVAKDFTAKTGVQVRQVYGPSGDLREKIEAGAPADLFASADLGHPLKLRQEGKAAAVAMFTRNRLCAFALPQAGLTEANFTERLADPVVKLGASTPGSDPAGDYAWAMFHAIDKRHPGAFAVLDAKAQQLSGGAAAAFASGKINVSVAYCSGADQALAATPGLTVIEVPAALSIGPEYGLAIMRLDKPSAVALAWAILSPEGQATLAKFGFAPIGLPTAR